MIFKLAVASDDGVNLSRHFGRSRYFLVFDVEDGKILGHSVRENTFAGRAGRKCQHGTERQHTGHGHHAGLAAVLGDCRAVICGGMGPRAAEELRQRGVEPVVVAEEMSPEEVVGRYLQGRLNNAEGFCPCQDR